jgi:hypothetical protein
MLLVPKTGGFHGDDFQDFRDQVVLDVAGGSGGAGVNAAYLPTNSLLVPADTTGLRRLMPNLSWWHRL